MITRKEFLIGLPIAIAGAVGVALGRSSAEQQASQTPQSKDNSSEAWVPIDNPVEFTINGIKYVWLFDNSTREATITQFTDGTKDSVVQIPQTLFSKELSQGPGISIRIVGIGIDVSTKQAIIMATTSSSQPNHYILHAILVKDITNLKDTMERITEVGLSDSPIQGAGTPIKIINDSTGHYAEALVQSSLDPANDGKRILHLGQLVSWVKPRPRVFLPATLSAFGSQGVSLSSVTSSKK